MARYVNHTIVYGDTIQSIAQQRAGSASLWEDIVEYNNLDYPYIVETLAEKMENPDNLRTVGDTIIVPIEIDLLDTNLESLGYRDRDLILGLALGRDLKVGYDEESVANKAMHGEILGLQADNSGDIEVVQGVENLRQATINRLLTPKGSLFLHPEYGSDFYKYIGRKNTEEVMTMIEDEITSTIQKDNRVDNVEVVDSRIEADNYFGEFRVILHSLQEYFEIVVEMDNQNNFSIT